LSENQKQFGSYLETVLDAIESAANQGTPAAYRGARAVFFKEDIIAGLREVLGNADHVYWAAEEAFRAGHQSAFDHSVPALMQDPTHRPNLDRLWDLYTPSEAIIDRVQAADA